MGSKRYRDKEWLKKKYLEEWNTIQDISNMCGVSNATIIKWMDRFEIERRNPAESKKGPEKREYEDEEWLRQKYHDEGLNGLEIAELCDVGRSTIYRQMDIHGIKRRSDIENESIRSPKEPYTDKDWLYEQYVEKEKSSLQIAEECDTSAGNICKWLNKFEIEIRNHKEAALKRRWESPDEPYTNKEWLEEKYWEEDKTVKEMASICNVCQNTIYNWMHKLGVDLQEQGSWVLSGEENPNYIGKEEEICLNCGTTFPHYPHQERKFCKHDCYKEYHKGENHSHWKGGRFPYGKGWNKQKKEKVRKRDNRECQDCGMGEEEHHNLWDRKLNVHHIEDPRDIDDPEKRNGMDNLVSLCCQCHSRRHANDYL